MTIDISYETDIKLDLPFENIINEMVIAALDYEKCPFEAEVSVSIVDDEEIKEIIFRNITS